MRKTTLWTLVMAVGLIASSAHAGDLRRLELFGFDTPVMGKLDPSYPGTGCTGRLVVLTEAAHDGAKGARLYFKIPKGSDGYVTWNYTLPVPAGEGTKSFSIWVRPHQTQGQLLFQLTDKEGWIVSSLPSPPAGKWIHVTLDFTRAEYSERKEKKPAWPIRIFTVGMTHGPSEGILDIDSLSMTTVASEPKQSRYVLEFATDQLGNLFRPDQAPMVRGYVRNFETAASPVFTGTYRVTDWLDQPVAEGTLGELAIPSPGVLEIPIVLKGMKRSGAYCLTAQIRSRETPPMTISGKTRFGILPEGLVEPVPWVGTCAHWQHGWGLGEAQMMRMLDLMNLAGIGAIKTGAHWPNMERGPGTFRSVESLDRYIDELKKRNMICSLTLSHANSHYENPLDPDAFARFAAWAVKYYRNTDRFEIWNEAGNTGFLKRYGQAKNRTEQNTTGIPWVNEFVKFTNTAVKAMKAARPDASVYVGAEDVCFYMQHMIDWGIGTGADGLAIHVYPQELRPETSDYLGDGLKDLRDRSRKKNGPTRVIITESGWSTCTCEWARKIVTTTCADQARYLVRMFLMSRAAGVDYALSYDFMDDGPNPDEKEHNFGLVGEDYSPKPAFLALAAMTRLVGKGKVVKDLSTDPAKFRAYVFDVAGKPVTAVWAIQGRLPAQFDCENGPMEVIDVMGNPQTLATPVGKLDLDLTENPIYLRNTAVKGIIIR